VRLLAGSPVRIEDLDDEAFVLVAATLARTQTGADAATLAGLEALELPATRRSHAKTVWDSPLPLGSWRDATDWADLGLEEQPEPQAGSGAPSDHRQVAVQ